MASQLRLQNNFVSVNMWVISVISVTVVAADGDNISHVLSDCWKELCCVLMGSDMGNAQGGGDLLLWCGLMRITF